MRPLALLALVLGIALVAGTAHADTFAVVPDTQAVSPFVTPPLTPNVDGSVVLPAELIVRSSTAPPRPQEGSPWS